MNKRSAIIVALGLTAALVLGGVGFSMGATGPTPSLATARHPAPKVRTIHRTVTVHRQASAAGTAVAAAPVTTVGATGGWEGGYEDDDHGYDDGHGSEDHDGPDHAEAGDD
jgi:hypothetical protein